MTTTASGFDRGTGGQTRMPALDIARKVNWSPHVVILGAGASAATCLKGDRFGRKLPTMRELVHVLELDRELKEVGLLEAGRENFETMYEQVASTPELASLRDTLDQRLRDYFACLRLPDEVTIYDLLIATLRAKDLIATFNWDPLILQAYERNLTLGELPRVAFLHGNVALGYCNKDRLKNSTGTCPCCKQPLEPSRLLYPVADKNYGTDPHIAREWEELGQWLEDAYMLTIFGYAAPASDVAARAALKATWDRNSSRRIAIIEVIDINDSRRLRSTWRDFIASEQRWVPRKRFRQAFQHTYPRRSCEALGFAQFQQEPWHHLRVPQFRRLDSLQNWVRPLIEEEILLAQEGKAFTPFGERRTPT